MQFGQIERSCFDDDLWSLCQTTTPLAYNESFEEKEERRDIWADFNNEPTQPSFDSNGFHSTPYLHAPKPVAKPNES